MKTYEEWETCSKDYKEQVRLGIANIKKYAQVHKDRGNFEDYEALCAVLDIVNYIVPFKHLLYEAINIQPYMGRDVKVINGERSSTMPLNKTYKMTGYSVTHILDEETGVFKVVYDIAIGEEYGGKCRYVLPVGKVNILEYTHNDEGDI